MSCNQIGRLILSSRNTYKINNKPAKQCLILSDDTIKEVMINTSKEFDTKDNYVIVDVINNKMIDNIGIIGNFKDDLNIYHYLHTYFWSSNSKLNRYFKDFDLTYDIVKEREDYTKPVITIDPYGSVDLDDGFSLEFKDNHIYLDIHIADPTSYFDFTKENTWNIIKELSTRILTCYIPLNDKIKHLLPEININNKNLLEISTLIGKDKRAISFCFKINVDTENINLVIKKTILKNITNTTYENYDAFINADVVYKNKLIDLCNFMIKKINCNLFLEDDLSHKLIEIFMIWTNYYAGNYLYESKNKMFVRTQDKFVDLNQNMPDYVRTFLNLGAKYEFVESKKDNKYFHYSLGIENYCHVTSPMRRFIDMVNHLLLHNIDLNMDVYNKFKNLIDTEQINSRLKKYKKLCNGYELLKHLKITNIFKGCIFDKLDDNKALIVLFDEFNNFKKIKKSKLPIGYEKINKFDEVKIQVFYDPYKFKSKSLPFSIKILE